MEFAVFISEDDLYEWSNSLTYRLPRNAYSVDAFSSVGKDDAWEKCWRQIVGSSESELFLAVFDAAEKTEASTIRIGESIPFWKVKRLLAPDENRAAILADRYGELGLSVEVLDSLCTRKLAILASREQDRIRTKDVAEGAKGLIEYFGVTVPHGFGKVVKAIAETVSTPSANGFLSLLLSYSRNEPWGCEGWLAAMCDLCEVMQRSCVTGLERYGAMGSLKKLIADAVKEGVDSVDVVVSVLRSCPKTKVLAMANVMFLRWKYAAEQSSGVPDLDLMALDIDLVQRIDPASCSIAVCAFGAFAGFKSFAMRYHAKMRREQMKNHLSVKESES